MARPDEDSVQQPPKVWDHLLQEIPWILCHRRWWEALSLALALVEISHKQIILVWIGPYHLVCNTGTGFQVQSDKGWMWPSWLFTARPPPPPHGSPGLENSPNKTQLVFSSSPALLFVDRFRAVAKWNYISFWWESLQAFHPSCPVGKCKCCHGDPLDVQSDIVPPGCRRDKDGYYWITGRIDDMLNVSGELQLS